MKMEESEFPNQEREKKQNKTTGIFYRVIESHFWAECETATCFEQPWAIGIITLVSGILL